MVRVKREIQFNSTEFSHMQDMHMSSRTDMYWKLTTFASNITCKEQHNVYWGKKRVTKLETIFSNDSLKRFRGKTVYIKVPSIDKL